MSVLCKLNSNKSQDELSILSSFFKEDFDKITQGLIGLSIAQNTIAKKISILENTISICQLKIRNALKSDNEYEAKKWLKKKLAYEEMLNGYLELIPEVDLYINKLHKEIQEINQFYRKPLVNRDLNKLRKVIS